MVVPAPIRKLSRDNPLSIKWRFLAIGIAIIFCTMVTHIVLISHADKKLQSFQTFREAYQTKSIGNTTIILFYFYVHFLFSWYYLGFPSLPFMISTNESHMKIFPPQSEQESRLNIRSCLIKIPVYVYGYNGTEEKNFWYYLFTEANSWHTLFDRIRPNLSSSTILK